MSLAVLELNDQSLLIEADGGSRYEEPGFARMTPEGLETGETARASAWREPQSSYNQFWNLLNQTPLAAKQKWARHHADIAFAQLKNLWQGAGSPESLVVLAPGSYTDAQLSLLLGMNSALPCETLAVVDNALAACLGARQDTLYVDMQLHQTVITRCSVQASALSITDQEIIPDLGLIQVFGSVARHISNLLIDSARYDPLHASDSEQLIFDLLPEWLTHLRWEREVSAKVNSDKGELPFILSREAVKQLVSGRLVNVRAFLERHPGCRLVLSHASGLLTVLSDEFSAAREAGQTESIGHVLTHHDLILGQVESLYRMQSLDRGESAAPGAKPGSRLATHVLYGDQALPLCKPVSIRIGERGVQLSNRIDKKAALTLVLHNRSLQAVHSAAGLESSIPQECSPGESILVNGHQLRLIEVHDG
jgi:hypothetical protein